MIAKKEVIEKLQKEVAVNPTANAVFHLLAVRKKSRSSLMLNALNQRMQQEGFHYSRQQYRAVLKLVASLGLATPIVSSRGNIKGINNIKATLNELGQAACGHPSSKNTAEAATAPAPKPVRTSSQIVKVSEKSKEDRTKTPYMNLHLTLNNKPVTLEFPSGLSPDELSALLKKLA